MHITFLKEIERDDLEMLCVDNYPKLTSFQCLSRISSYEKKFSRQSWRRNYVIKDIRFGVNSRATMMQGVEQLEDTIKVTKGPKGHNIIIEKSYGVPNVTKDVVAMEKVLNSVKS